MTKPTVFISHRHADKAIAQVVADFLNERSAGAASIFCSSSVDFVRPTAGDSLEVSLKHALAVSDVVVLIFTSETEDWSYCMWECGVATDPEDRRPTKVVVLQCGDPSPKPFADHVRVDLRSLDSVTGFVKTMLTTVDYFPHRDSALTGFSADSQQIRDCATTLHTKLADVLADLRRDEVEESSAATYLCVELDRDAVAELRALEAADTVAAAEIVRTRGRIVDKRGARSLFKFQLDNNISLGRILDEWCTQQREAGAGDAAATEARWFDSVIAQIRTVVAGRFPLVAWAPFDVEAGKAIIPFVSGCRTVPATGGLQLHLYFVPISPRPVPVTERMIGLEEMFHKNLAETPGESIRLAELAAEMRADGRSRVPMLGEGGRPRFVVHRSMIQEFIAERAMNGEEVKTLTVHDLLVDPQTVATFERSFAVVDRSADMDHALAAMNAMPGCQDVFVTADGTATGALVGWVTNTMFTS